MPLCKLSTCNLSGPNVLSTPANFSDFISNLICSDSLRGIQGTQGIQGIQGPAGGGSTLQVYNLETNIVEETLSRGFINNIDKNIPCWGTKDFINTNILIGTKQAFIRYDRNKTGLKFQMRNGNDNSGYSVFRFEIIAKDITNQIEYVLAVYERNSPANGNFSISDQAFITPSKTTRDFYTLASNLNLDASGNYYIINSTGNSDSKTDFTLLGSLNSSLSTIFKYNGVSATGTGTVIKVTRADMLITDNYYVIKLTGSVNWTAIGSLSSTVGTLFKYNGLPLTSGTTGCCLESTDLDLTNTAICIRSSGINLWGDDGFYIEPSSISCLSVTPLSSLTETTYAARCQSSIGYNINQVVESGYDSKSSWTPFNNLQTNGQIEFSFQ